MKFKIYSRNPNGEEVIHFYDNIHQDIYTEKNIPVVLNKDPRCSELVKQFSSKFEVSEDGHVYSQLKSDTLSDLRITLGFNCNFNCKYCAQQKTQNKERTPSILIKEDLDTKVNNLIEKLKLSKVKTRHITFWGGEPFVYFKTVQKLVPKLKEIFPDVEMGIITNGSLLTLAKVKYLLDNQINLTVSHDGPSFNTYRDDKNPLDNPKIVEAIKYYDENAEAQKVRFSFNCVVTPENADLRAIDEYFTNVFGRPIRFNFESIAKLDSLSIDVINPFNLETTSVLLNNLVAFGSTATNTHAFGSIRDRVTSIMKKLVSKADLTQIPTYCNIASKDFLAVDMKGNLLECHGFAETYGSLTDISNAVFKIRHPWTTRSNCAKCPYLVSCIGGCSMVNHEDHEIACKNLQIWHAGLFIAAWKILFNTTIYKIEPLGEEDDNRN